MFIKGICKKCNGTVIVDIEDMSIEEAKKKLEQTDFGHCQAGGFHVELYKMIDGYQIDFDHMFNIESEARAAVIYPKPDKKTLKSFRAYNRYIRKNTKKE